MPSAALSKEACCRSRGGAGGVAGFVRQVQDSRGRSVHSFPAAHRWGECIRNHPALPTRSSLRQRRHGRRRKSSLGLNHRCCRSAEKKRSQSLVWRLGDLRAIYSCCDGKTIGEYFVFLKNAEFSQQILYLVPCNKK